MSIGFLTLDIIIILVIFLGTFIYSYNAGKKQVAKLLLAVYPALLIFLQLPFVGGKDPAMVIGIFVGVYLIIYFLLRRNFTAPSANSGGKKFIDGLFLSISAVFTLLIIYYHVLPISSLYTLKLPFSGFLVEKIPFYITILIPIIFIVFTNKRDN
jgi:hypothetical protein